LTGPRAWPLIVTGVTLMSVEEIIEELQALYQVPASRAKTERLEDLARRAKETGDQHLEAQVLLDVSRGYEYGAEGEKLPLALGRLLRLADQYPAEVGVLVRSIHWQLKWMTEGMIRNPAVPLETVYRWLEELESRYRQQGYSLRPVLADRSDLAQLLGDEAAASAAMEASIAARRDQMCDCLACERNSWGTWREWLGDDEGALEHWGPVLNGTNRCSEEPHRVLSYALLSLIRVGRFDEARSAFLRGYPMVKGNINLMPSVGRHIEFCALTGNEARGLEILAEHSAWLADTQVDTIRRLDFLEGVTVLLRRLHAFGHGDLAVGGSFTVATLRDSCEAEIREICLLYDKRNGTSALSDRVTARLARQPLVDHLPLGLPSRLPAAAPAVTAAAVGSGPASTLADLTARARELDEAHHPEADKAWRRVAEAASASGEEPPPPVALRVAEAQAASGMRTDAAAARTALLEVADSFAAAGDQPGALRARATAARALSVVGDHAAARAEGAALAAAASAALAEGTLTPRQYLAARGSEHMIVAHMLGAAESRDERDVDAAVAAVSDTLTEAERYDEPHSKGRCYELLAQLDFWHGDQENAVKHLQAARESYIAAREPWSAAGPSATLGEFALQQGDPAAAESYARFAQANVIGMDPRSQAMLASLLVESLLAQPDRALDVADAALAAAARWDGISEPDALHNTFHAAHAYASLDRHGEAAALFAQAMPRVTVPYDQTGVAMTREKYGRSLRALKQHKEAASQFLEAARLIADDPDNARAHAALASVAAEELRRAGEGESALAAFRRAADLYGKLGDTVNRVRSQRSAAWLEHWLAPAPPAPADLDTYPGVVTMREVLAELEPLVAADGPAELAKELENTREQLAQILEELAHPDSEEP
jgi:tetratricopeptide (TPR) repeat protein